MCLGRRRRDRGSPGLPDLPPASQNGAHDGAAEARCDGADEGLGHRLADALTLVAAAAWRDRIVGGPLCGLPAILVRPVGHGCPPRPCLANSRPVSTARLAN